MNTDIDTAPIATSLSGASIDAAAHVPLAVTPTSLLPDAPTARLHLLSWRPGAAMHDSWWAALDLAPWQAIYLGAPACRHAIDALIVQRRGFPAYSFNGLPTASGRRLLALENRLPALCVALGLIVLDCDDHLLLGEYRRALHAVLGSNGCDKILMLKSGQAQGHGCGQRIPLEGIVDTARQVGFLRLQVELSDCPSWRALSVTLPFYSLAESSEVETDDIRPSTSMASATSMLFRLERFL